jgi:hypothetical protein
MKQFLRSFVRLLPLPETIAGINLTRIGLLSRLHAYSVLSILIDQYYGILSTAFLAPSLSKALTDTSDISGALGLIHHLH